MLNFATIGKPQAETNAKTNGKAEDRPQATIWLNVGVTIPMANEQGVTEDVFVALPVGIPVDTTEHIAMRGSSKNWAQMVQAKNWLLDQLKKAGADLEPGQGEIIQGLEIQLKRVGGAAAEPVAGENPLLQAMAARLKVA